MSNAVPMELLESVIESRSNENHKALLACPLVCRGGVPRSRRYLFKKCSLYHRNVLAFGQLLDSPLCTFLPHVRWISASRNHSRQGFR
ncbi:hypothetical protein B0H19DRAFT_1157608 [Mycena capillaripes]|nr:hypothetical protein B0H19DRAFT_1157608 [Mycena capillaripes]